VDDADGQADDGSEINLNIECLQKSTPRKMKYIHHG
jgi:hypothetical protein